MFVFEQQWKYLLAVGAVITAAIIAQRLLVMAINRVTAKNEPENNEPSNNKLVMGILNWTLFMITVSLCFYIVPPARDLLNSDFRYIIILVGVVILTIFLQRLVRFGVGRYLRKSAEHLNVDPTAFNFLKNALNSIIIFIAIVVIIYTIPAFRSLGATLLTSAGIIAAIAAFASQHALANIVSGVFIVIFKPFRVNDIIQIGADVMGRIEDITLRHTVIRNFENRRVIIPNSTISSETIINSNLVDEKLCVRLEIGISYDSDIDRAMNIMRTVAERHPLCIDNRDEGKKAGNPIVVVRVIALADFAITLRAWIWAKDADDAFVMKCDLLKEIKEEFDRQGIEIPYPHHTLVYKTEVLKERQRQEEILNRNIPPEERGH